MEVTYESIFCKKASNFKCPVYKVNNYNPLLPEAALLPTLLIGEGLPFLKDAPFFPQLQEQVICPRKFKETVGKSKTRWVGHGMTQGIGTKIVGGEAEPQDSD